MDRLTYTSAVTKEKVVLDGDVGHVGIAGEFRAGRWGYDLEGRSLTSPRRQAQEVELELTTTKEAADRITAIADADISMSSPGMFEGDGWRQRGYITEVELDDVSGKKCKLNLTAVLLDGVWHKEELLSMRQSSGDARGTKVYPYEYPYYYASEYGVRYLELTDATPIPFRFVFYGPALNPTVRIAGNYYQFNVSVPAGGYLEVSSLPDPKVELVGEDGTRVPMFSCAVRGDGEGSGNYAFEKIPTGTSEVWWSDMFGFDLFLVHERGDFPICS